MSRSRSIKSPFDYRRYVTLVQTLATGDYNAILALYGAWELEPMETPDTLLMMYRLAEHAVHYHRENTK